jgi:hypothetical protein
MLILLNVSNHNGDDESEFAIIHLFEEDIKKLRLWQSRLSLVALLD